MRILIVGNGGREHALLWKLRRDAPEAEFFITRGNGGTTGIAESIPIDPTELEVLPEWAAEHRIDLAVVGPEAPLAAGMVDRFGERDIPAFGPTAAAAEIESSKAFTKRLLQHHGIPTAAFATFDDAAAAEQYVRSRGGPLVVKASGLAAGKGAIVCETTEQAVSAVRSLLAEAVLGEAGRTVVIEEFMRGEELSVFALSDGERVLPMLPAQDHKRAGEGDTGPNTGGMGAYAPVSIATPELLERIAREILRPTVAAMAEEGRPFRGLLYAGLMLTDDGPRVVEFNCRFGDPETQVVLPLLESSLLEPMLAIASGEGLTGWERDGLRWRAGAAVTTVVAADGYPGSYPKGMEVVIPPEVTEAGDLLVLHAGTAQHDGKLVTTGGRILAVTALAPTVREAAARSRWGAERIRIDRSFFRRDIAWREIERTGSFF
ncbi:MAG TPA: phosphoribosylamine--glycine ligase [Longimicrobiaceae bacterium]